MPWTTPPALHERARIGSLSRSRAHDDPELLDARRNLKFERLAEHVKQVVDSAPELSPDQIDKLASLLRPAS